MKFNNFKIWIAAFALLIALPLSAKKTEQSKVYNYKTACSKDVKFKLIANDTKININTWDKDEIVIKLTVLVEAEDQESVDTFLSKVDFKPLFSNNELSLAPPLSYSGYNSNSLKSSSRIKITFKDGDKVKVNKHKMEYEIFMPKSGRLYLKNSYGDVNIGDLSGESVIDLNSADLTAGLLSRSKITVKYADANVEGMHDGSLKLFEGNLNLKHARDLKLNTRYSRVNIEKADKLSLTSYEDKIQIGSLDELTVNIKYSSLEVLKLQNLKVDQAYELDAKLPSIGRAEFLNTKYSNYLIGTADELKINQSYEDDIYIESIDRFLLDGKYAKIKILKLNESCWVKGYEVDVKLENVAADFGEIRVEGKYMDLIFAIATSSKYQLNAKVKYPDFSYDAGAFDVETNSKTGETIDLKMSKKGISGKQRIPVINVSGYEMEMKLTDI